MKGKCPWCHETEVTLGPYKDSKGNFSLAAWCPKCKVWAFNTPIRITRSERIHIPAT